MKNLCNIHVLIVEDDPVNMLVASKFLEAQHADVSQASNGDDALRKLYTGTKPDLVLLDLEMPGRDGYSVIYELRKQLPLLPVLAFTAYVIDRKLKFTLQQRGFNGAIPKPYTPQLLYEIISNTLKQKNKTHFPIMTVTNEPTLM